MKVLNIDALVTPKRFLEFKGEKYAVREIGVQEFIDNLAAAEAMVAEEGEDKSPISKQIVAARDQIKDAIPTLPLEILNSWGIEVIGKVLELIRGDLDDAVAAANDATQTPEGDAEKKPS